MKSTNYSLSKMALLNDPALGLPDAAVKQMGHEIQLAEAYISPGTLPQVSQSQPLPSEAPCNVLALV